MIRNKWKLLPHKKKPGAFVCWVSLKNGKYRRKPLVRSETTNKWVVGDREFDTLEQAGYYFFQLACGYVRR